MPVSTASSRPSCTNFFVSCSTTRRGFATSGAGECRRGRGGASCAPMSDDPHYYHAPDLAKFGDISKNAGELGKKFFDWYTAVFAEGALSAREKSLIALAVAHAVQCPYCIDAYSKDALEKGS